MNDRVSFDRFAFIIAPPTLSPCTCTCFRSALGRVSRAPDVQSRDNSGGLRRAERLSLRLRRVPCVRLRDGRMLRSLFPVRRRSYGVVQGPGALQHRRPVLRRHGLHREYLSEVLRPDDLLGMLSLR